MSKPLDRRQRNREHDARRRAEKPWRGWYNTKRWQDIRDRQFAKEPLCERCMARGQISPATVCHHVDRHEGNAIKFWNGPFASSCDGCHNTDEQRIERGGRARQAVGDDGWPVDGA